MGLYPNFKVMCVNNIGVQVEEITINVKRGEHISYFFSLNDRCQFFLASILCERLVAYFVELLSFIFM